MIEYKQQQEMLYELKMMLDLRFGNGFYDQIQAEYQKRLKEQKELERVQQINKRKQVERTILGTLIFAALGIVATIIVIVINQIKR